MRNKKGFTLVELVIVIAVIAILAGVMIGTFASVVKKAKKSAEQQEMAAAKQEQVANDVIEKLNNGSWLGWTDFEEKLAKALADVNITADGGMTEASVKAAVAAALNEYAAAHPDTDKPNTGLTEQQVKYIIENALSGQLTAEQVKAIVNNAVSSTSTLTKSQVQAIVDAAIGKTMTASQVKEVVNEVLTQNKVGTSTLTIEQIEKLINSKNYSVLTEKEIEKIVKEALKGYAISSTNVSSVKDIKDALNDPKVTNAVITISEDFKVADADKKDATDEKGNSFKAAFTITKDTVIDLGVHKIDLDNARIVVEKGATLTIKGDGEIVSTSRAVESKGTLVIDGGTISGGDKNGTAAVKAAENSFLTINGGTFTGYNGESYYLVYPSASSTVVINGGTFTASTPIATNGAFSPYSSLIINDGEFIGDDAKAPVVFIPSATVSIYGGTFTGKSTVLSVCGGDTRVYGGTFTSTGKDVSAPGNSGPYTDGNAICVIENRSSGYSFSKLFISKSATVVPATGMSAVKVYAGTGVANEWGAEKQTIATITDDVTITK